MRTKAPDGKKDSPESRYLTISVHYPFAKLAKSPDNPATGVAKTGFQRFFGATLGRDVPCALLNAGRHFDAALNTAPGSCVRFEMQPGIVLPVIWR
ncbi:MULTISPECIES: hypothetical protein [unclassified Marinovum]